MSDKAREFFIQFNDLCYDEDKYEVTVKEGTDANVEPNEKVHVIEYKAFQVVRTAKASKDLYCDQIEKEMGREISHLKSEIKSFYDVIAHGDAEHRLWLRRAFELWTNDSKNKLQG